MRPVDKGKAPDITFNEYQDAEPHLEERIGPYCSYCEFPIKHVPEVDHKEAKAGGGALLEWENPKRVVKDFLIKFTKKPQKSARSRF